MEDILRFFPMYLFLLRIEIESESIEPGLACCKFLSDISFDLHVPIIHVYCMYLSFATCGGNIFFIIFSFTPQYIISSHFLLLYAPFRSLLLHKTSGRAEGRELNIGRKETREKRKINNFMSSPSPGMNSFPSWYFAIVNRGIIRMRCDVVRAENTIVSRHNSERWCFPLFFLAHSPHFT